MALIEWIQFGMQAEKQRTVRAFHIQCHIHRRICAAQQAQKQKIARGKTHQNVAVFVNALTLTIDANDHCSCVAKETDERQQKPPYIYGMDATNVEIRKDGRTKEHNAAIGQSILVLFATCVYHLKIYCIIALLWL